MRLEYIGKSSGPLKVFPSHQHDDYWELVYNDIGSGTMIIEGKSYDFYPGSVMLYPPCHSHYKVAENQFEDYYILLSECDYPKGVYCFNDDKERIGQLARILYSCFCEPVQPQICQDIFTAITGLLNLENSKTNKNVRELRHIIVDSFTDSEFTISDAMAKLPINSDHLRRCFKRDLGMTPGDYLTHLRLSSAKRLLKETHMSIAEVAFLSGYDDPLYFSRVFKKHMTVSPKGWRSN